MNNLIAELVILSLGGGIQSTTLALMAMHGLIAKPDFAIFANTGWEDNATIDHINNLKKLLDYPIIEVNAGSLFDDLVNGLTNNDDYFTKPPFFHTNGSIGRRLCTTDYKIVPIKRQVRKLLKVGVRTRLYGRYIDMMIGISRDECHRAKPSNVEYINNVYPLLQLAMTRLDCEQWLIKHGYDVPVKSACIGCPFHSNYEWQRIKTENTTQFYSALEIDDLLRSRRSPEYMHKSLKPINNIKFVDDRQFDLFGNDCSGLCGV